MDLLCPKCGHGFLLPCMVVAPDERRILYEGMRVCDNEVCRALLTEGEARG